MNDPLHWWQDGVIYQVLVPSFLDTNGDGIGDLPGVIGRLEYLEWLGVRALWLSPIYTSPLRDLGYDVSDFNDVHPTFGTLDDFDRLVEEAHRRHLKIILDWIPNHTSADHPWFIESASSRENAKRDWYLWRDGQQDQPPNNWLSVFGGSIWQWHEPTGQYYLHTFLDKQPDLNWRNPEVREAMHQTLRFWLERGVDGFRIDALDLVLKDDQFRDNPPNPDWTEGQAPDLQVLSKYSRNQPGIHDLIADLRSTLDEYGDDRMLAGELYLPIDDMVTYYGEKRPELHLPLNLKLTWCQWEPQSIVEIIDQYDQSRDHDCWPTWTISTHDSARLAARCQGEQTRVAAMLLLTLGGTPTHYYGEEIGMRGVPIPPDQAIDPQGRLAGRNRDPERTPMQWNAEQHAGFSEVEPWLPIADDFTTANVAAQSEQEHSLLNLYRRLIQLRQSRPALLCGQHDFVDTEAPLITYRRSDENDRLLVVLNLSGDPQSLEREDLQQGTILLSTFLNREGEPVEGKVEIGANEGLVILLA